MSEINEEGDTAVRDRFPRRFGKLTIADLGQKKDELFLAKSSLKRPDFGRDSNKDVCALWKVKKRRQFTLKDVILSHFGAGQKRDVLDPKTQFKAECIC